MRPGFSVTIAVRCPEENPSPTGELNVATGWSRNGRSLRSRASVAMDACFPVVCGGSARRQKRVRPPQSQRILMRLLRCVPDEPTSRCMHEHVMTTFHALLSLATAVPPYVVEQSEAKARAARRSAERKRCSTGCRACSTMPGSRSGTSSLRPTGTCRATGGVTATPSIWKRPRIVHRGRQRRH